MGQEKNSAALTCEKLLILIVRVKSAKTSQKKVPRDYWLLQHYDILEVQGVKKLIVPVINAKLDVVFYCSCDMLFVFYAKCMFLLGMVVKTA